MALSRKVSVRQALRYRGKMGMTNWILHRITGLGIVIFVASHVIAAFFGQQMGSDLAFAINTLYQAWITQLFIYFCVLFHAFNGARLALMDLFPNLLRFQKELLWLQWIIFIPFYGLPTYFLVQNGLAGG